MRIVFKNLWYHKNSKLVSITSSDAGISVNIRNLEITTSGIGWRPKCIWDSRYIEGWKLWQVPCCLHGCFLKSDFHLGGSCSQQKQNLFDKKINGFSYIKEHHMIEAPEIRIWHNMFGSIWRSINLWFQICGLVLQ